MTTWRETVTPLYRFRFRSGSLAEREIASIARVQALAMEHIMHVLGASLTERVTYVLCDSPADVAEQSGADEATAAITSYPSTVFAEYSEANRCIGPHEDAHLVANTVGYPESTFIREAVAMYFDGTWWGLPNRAWVQRYLADGSFVPPSVLMANESFDELDCSITYPIAGFWAELIMQRFGPAAFRTFYARAERDPIAAFGEAFGHDLAEFDTYVEQHANDVVFGAPIVTAVAAR